MTTRAQTIYHNIAIGIDHAYHQLKDIVDNTPLQHNLSLSSIYGGEVFLKREDLQVVRSYKIRGAYHKFLSLDKSALKLGVVCASAGNHAQGVAYACKQLGIKGWIYMPQTTPKQKIQRVALFGGDWIEIIITGDDFDDSYQIALAAAEDSKRPFIHPFEDPVIIEGQGTVGLEILQQQPDIDYLFLPIGGGGLAAGVGSYIKSKSPGTRIIGIEPEGAPAMRKAFDAGHPVDLKEFDVFVDGAAVRKVGKLNFEICKEVLDEIITVPEGKICSTILKLYNEEAIVVEPAGAMSIAALDSFKSEIRGKKVACIVSGGNNDVMRMEDIKERAMLFEGLKFYFIIKFPQRAGALQEFLKVLGPKDDITHFEYTKKHNRETGPALVGIELSDKRDFEPLIKRMERFGIDYQLVNNDPLLFRFLI